MPYNRELGPITFPTNHFQPDEVFRHNTAYNLEYLSDRPRFLVGKGEENREITCSIISDEGVNISNRDNPESPFTEEELIFIPRLIDHALTLKQQRDSFKEDSPPFLSGNQKREIGQYLTDLGKINLKYVYAGATNGCAYLVIVFEEGNNIDAHIFKYPKKEVKSLILPSAKDAEPSHVLEQVA